MACGRNFMLFVALSLMANAFSVPVSQFRRRRFTDNQLDSKEMAPSKPAKRETNNNHSTTEDMKSSSTTRATVDSDKSDDDFDDVDDDFGNSNQNSASNSGGSNIFSLLNLASALFPSSSGSNPKYNNLVVKKLIQDLIGINRNQVRVINKRQDTTDNVIDIDYTADLRPPPHLQKLEIDETDNSESIESSSEDSDEDNGAEESVEKESSDNGSKSKQESGSNASNGNEDDDNDSDYDEPPPGDGQGGGILGLLAGLSGDGESDLGTLLATVGGIVASLSGDGVDINAIIATGLGLLVGLLSEGEQNPGEIIASYLLTSLDTITGGGAKNNGAFFGKFISKLVKGTSAGGDPDASGSDEENGMKMADSAGFFVSLLMGLLGDMSKTSSGGSW